MIQLFGVTLTWRIVLELAGVVLMVLAGSVLIASLIQRALAAWAHRRGLAPEDVGIPIVRRYLLPILLVGTLHATLSALALPRHLHAVVTRVLSATTLGLGLYIASQIILGLLGELARRSAAGRRVSPDVLTMARVTLFVVSAIILLDNLGIHVTALVTTLGIGSLAVALGLQDTLTNFFAGLYLKADRPLREGDYVRLDSGQEGAVIQIGWRSTRLRTLSSNVVVVPNEKLSKAVITNFSLPSPHVSLDLSVTVPYGADVAGVERLLLEAAARARADQPALLPEPAPVARLIPGFSEAGLEFTLTAWVRSFGERFAAEDAIRRHIVALFRAESVEIRRG